MTAILTGLQTKQIDRSQFTANCNAYFNQDALDDFASTLRPLGAVTHVTRVATRLRGGMSYGVWQVNYANGTILAVTTYVMPDGKIEQLLVEGKA